MSGRAALLAVAAALVALAAAPPAAAHALDLTTARVEVRDRHAEIVVELDPIAALGRTDPSAGDASAIAAAEEPRLAGHAAALRRAFEDGVRLEADGATVPLVVRRAPTAEELRRAAREAASPGGHPTATVRLESTRPLPEARRIAVVLPAVAGRALYTYSQPATRLAEPGGGADFAVLAPRAEAAPPAPSVYPAPREERARDPGWRGWLAVAAGALAIAALLSHLVPRARRVSA